MNGNPLPSDTELFHKVAQYDSKALEALYNRYSPILYTLVKKIVTDERLAEDVLSDVFVIIWRKIDVFGKELNNPYTWLITLARNKAVDSLRRTKENHGLPEYNDEYENEFIIPKLSRLGEPLDIKSAILMKNIAEESLNKLTDAQQYVLYLAYYEGLTQKEIAAKLNIPLPTVKSKIRKALSNLKDNMRAGGS